MLSRRVRVQLVAFVAVTVLAVGYCLITYVRLPERVGLGHRTVTVELPDTGDLYPRALVTLRGVPVGSVLAIDLTATGTTATLSLRDDLPVPRDSRVAVRSMSAVGEQYLDFQPSGRPGPELVDGDVIGADRAQLPTSDADLLRNTNALVASVPAPDLHTTVHELGAALDGRSGDLRRVLDSATGLAEGLDENMTPIRRLVEDLGPVLDTQQALSPRVGPLFRDLATVTDQLRASDGDLRGVVEKAPPTLRGADQLIDGLRPPLPGVLTDLTGIAEILTLYGPGLQQTVVILPAGFNQLQSAVYNTPIPGAIKLNFKTTVNDSPPCTTGFQGDRQRDPNDLSPAPPAVDAYCKEPASSPIGVRMGRNAPCPNDPARRSRTASGCGLNFQTPADALRSRQEAVRTQLEVAERNPTSVERPETAAPPDPGGVEARPSSRPTGR